MEERQGKRLTDPEVVRKLEAIRKRVRKCQILLELVEADMEEAAMHRARARKLRRAINGF